MKCDIHHQKNAHPKTSPTEYDGVQQFQFQTSLMFPQYKQVWKLYEHVVWGDRKKHDVNHTKQDFIQCNHNTNVEKVSVHLEEQLQACQCI